ncbi:tudor domain-containing protein 1 isoform X2 [Notechis scutatus]|uniref:Tudor domain-containing protein 1 isoform X2 n=1 Tax=Notechis scutatus TaxID=8663 RepID=A0A6J1TXL1_9SAUR|nr:tudor domain-containing protein 1 isoform X2 [Notechis scutatus]
MEQRLQIKDLKSPNQSLRSPSTSPNFKNTVLVDNKVPPLLNNLPICGQAKSFVTNWNENNNHDGYDHKTVPLNMAGTGMKAPPANSLLFVNHLPPSQSPESKLNDPEGKFKVTNNLLSSSKKMNPVSDSALIQTVHLSTSDKALPISYNSQFSPLSPLYQPTCHFCGLFGSLRCIQCMQVYYCSASCQMKDWQTHNNVCKPSKTNANKAEYCRKSLDESNKKENILSVNTKNVEQGKKIMLSDLNYLGLKKNMKIKGTITDFNNPSEFYMQVNSLEVQSNIIKLTMKLKDYKGINQEYIPVKGEVCIAKYSLDQTWCRVLIKEIDILTKSAQVLYIDYGKRENILLQKIKGLHEDISQIPPCAIKCRIANILDTELCNENYKNIIAPIVVGKYCSLIITDVSMDDMPCFTVDAVLSDYGKPLHEIILENIHDWNAKVKDSKKVTSAMDHTVEKKYVQEKKVERKELDDNDCLTPNIVSVSIGDAFLGMVAHIQNPGIFFCQQTVNGCKLSQLQVSLREYCENTLITPDFCPAVGDVCCAQFTEDNQWYRATVISFISEKIALVGYIDYGNFEMLQLNRLRPIVQKLMELPMQAINCTLAGVKPISGIWPAEATFAMKQLVQNKVVAIKVTDKKMNTSVVEITDESVTPSVNISKYLLELGYAVEEAPILLKPIETVKETNGEKQEPVNWSWVTLTAKQVVNVMVSVLYNPSKFYCQLLNKDDLNALKELNLSLAEYCEKTKPNVSQIIKGKVYGAYFSEDGRWYRAYVKDVISLEVIKVQFVDYGNYEEITLDKIRQISSTFLKLPFQGIKCWLSGVRPINNKWTTEAITTFQTYATEKKLQARVISVIKNGAEVELIDNSNSIPMISEILIKKHLAFKEDLILNPNTVPGTSTSMQWTMPTFSIGDTLSALVLDVVDPGLFYVIPKEMKVDLEKLKKLMTELADYCYAENDNIFQPKIGEPCCARFSGDDKWYRALVLEINVSEVKVVYADYGNVEMLPFSRLQPITAPYLKLPFQILKCSLAGIMGLDGKWSISAIEKLKSLLMNQHVIITVKEVTQNIYPVIVQKKSENCVMDIAEQLITENLAKYSSNGDQCSKTTDCYCVELKKQVAKLEQILYFLLKDRFGEDNIPDILKPLEK